MDIHICPVGDLLPHVSDPDCTCLPHVRPEESLDGVVNYLYIHNAWDGRE